MVVLAVLPFQMWKNLLLLLTEKRITGIHLPERSPNPEDHPLKSHCCLAASFRSLFSHTHFFLTFIADCFSFHLPSSLSNISNQITDRLALVPLYFFYCSQTHRTVFFFSIRCSLLLTHTRNTWLLAREGVRTTLVDDQFKRKNGLTNFLHSSPLASTHSLIAYHSRTYPLKYFTFLFNVKLNRTFFCTTVSASVCTRRKIRLGK